MLTAAAIVEKLGLTKHPEGGYFREVYRSPETIAAAHLPERFTGPRCFSTSIYFMLVGEEFSAFHRIKQDEVWHFYAGIPIGLHVLAAEGGYYNITLGADINRNETFQAVVKAGDYFGAELSVNAKLTNDVNTHYALAGCTVAPGFDFADFEMSKREVLTGLYPQQQSIIARLTRS